ncbi:helix-turn-helix domain-containing protein [Klebsiella phage LASTA]|uniref:Helix-turn-helix domain-containing protein n=3 Tax=Lastavirus TaxID=2843414 RepID=A0A6H0X3J0_9CAUD|nr:helix-turn-helix domain-containing protein [Klebsiella phage LASTA]YP_010078939.1 hypothetical protein KMC54_gp48 [Klebsiella phage SopranoGao]QIW86748.1 helix-turn-helix domain-containing protein [Klebsiella phage SJM3]DAL60000.1 MAG TPA_asm: centromere-binding protein [Caudoviricetes sp.]ASV45071.1 hypothetical protein SopranoGao_48 [Klebsiella phage SopranoGao]QIW86672.1 helix-turn-helix domain-containing protein [Klebsiella phage LASTA]
MTPCDKALPLKEYIDLNFAGNRAAFARSIGTTRQHVNKMLNGEWIVFQGKLWSSLKGRAKTTND